MIVCVLEVVYLALGVVREGTRTGRDEHGRGPELGPVPPAKRDHVVKEARDITKLKTWILIHRIFVPWFASMAGPF